MLQHDHAGMVHDTDYLKLAIFKALVLQHLLYRHLHKSTALHQTMRGG